MSFIKKRISRTLLQNFNCAKLTIPLTKKTTLDAPSPKTHGKTYPSITLPTKD
ncbi:MAG: hypothetical protein HC793_02600 [Aquincola sp.]|nr:hypothetical protein [Aquincola sp.]